MEAQTIQSTDVGTKREGRTTRAIERRTGRVPSGVYFTLAVAAMAASAAYMLRDRKEVANFIGHWAPALLVIGLYNKIVKLESELLGES